MSHWENKGKIRSDEWYTPEYIFDSLGCVFDLDVAAPKDIKTFVPANKSITENSLSIEWQGFVWCNPPFGGRNGILPWCDKMIEHNNGILLTPDRTSAPWWQHVAFKAISILFISGKVKFISGIGLNTQSPSNGTTLLAFGDKANKALLNAYANNLGLILRNPIF